MRVSGPFTRATRSATALNHFSNAINWAQPWYASIAARASEIIPHEDWLAAANTCAAAQALANHRGQPLRFAPQDALPAGLAYETFISDSGCVPTRDNLHDYLNALVWLSFPRIKAQLNALQAAQIARSGIGASRGAARDAVTLFDENAAILVVRDGAEGQALSEALRAHQWQRAFMDMRNAFGTHAEVWLFGHALMEKLVTPYKGITAHTWALTAPDAFFALPQQARQEWIDIQMADELKSRDPDEITPACFTPLPVLGVPEWWPGQDGNFYADASVFRPKSHGRNPA